MNFGDRLNSYINTHPKQSLQLLAFGVAFIWQTPVAIIGLILYVLLGKSKQMEWWAILGIGVFSAGLGIVFNFFDVQTSHIIHHGFLINKMLWFNLFKHGPESALSVLYHYDFSYIFGFSLLIAGILSAIDLIQSNPHQEAIKALQQGKCPNERKEISSKKLELALNKLNESSYDCTVLGVSKYSGRYVGVPDYYINQIILVLGTTGGGKTITLRRFHHRAITKGFPLVLVDGKPSEENVAWLMKLAAKHGRPFYGFNCGNYFHYDCLASGGYTELKDKIISLKDQWESDYYRSIAEDYLQTTLQALLKSGKDLNLKKIAECQDYDTLLNTVREMDDAALLQQVSTLGHYDRKDIPGLQAHLNILINSELGPYIINPLKPSVQRNGC